PRTVRQRMFGFDISSFDGQPERDAAHVELLSRLGKSEPAFGPAAVDAIRWDAVIAAERRHSFPRPAVSPSRHQPTAAQGAGNDVIRADAHKYSYRIHNLLRTVSAIVATPPTRDAKFRVHAAFPVDQGNNLAGLPIYVHHHLFNQRSYDAFFQASIGGRMA